MKTIISIALVTFLAACGGSSDDSPAEDNIGMMAGGNNMSGDGSGYTCGNSDHPKVGQMAILSTLAHDVAGQVLIKDNCTLEVTGFSYDGGGPSVYFYGGVDGDYDAQGFRIGEQLNGQVYNDASFTVTLDSAAHLDQMNGISVWCYDFAVSFGDGLFM